MSDFQITDKGRALMREALMEFIAARTSIEGDVSAAEDWVRPYVEKRYAAHDRTFIEYKVKTVAARVREATAIVHEMDTAEGWNVTFY